MEFRRDSGEGGAPQRWIDHNLPTCPFCKTEALWETAEESDQLALTRWAFRCPNCKVVLSTIQGAPVATPMELTDPAAQVRMALERNVRVDGVERREDEDFLGQEFPLSELQEWASEDES